MDALMMRNAMTTTFNSLLAGLDHHLTTCEIVGKGWKSAVEVA